MLYVFSWSLLFMKSCHAVSSRKQTQRLSHVLIPLAPRHGNTLVTSIFLDEPAVRSPHQPDDIVL